MKNIYILLIACFISVTAFAQAPEGMSYQAVIKDAQNRVLISKKISIKISIIQDSNDGSAVYSETQSLKTNSNGLVSLTIGAGDSQDSFGDIDWAYGSYYIKTEIDPKGGNNYAIKGTSQLLSVPYALHAKTAEGVVGYGKGAKPKDGSKEIDPIFTDSPASSITEERKITWDIDNDPLNEIQDLTPYQTISGTATWDKDSSDDFSGSFSDLTNIPAELTDGDNVDDADNDPNNELQEWSNLPGIPADLKSGTLGDTRIASSNVTQHESSLFIGNLIGSPTGTVVGNTDAQTLTNKTINADLNTVNNINNAAIKAGAAIDATKISDGSVSNSEFQKLNDVSSSVVGTSDTQNLTNKTLTSAVLTTPQINDTSTDHQYIVSVSELVADRIMTLPLLNSNDIFVFEDQVQTLTNKTLTAPVISSIVNTGTITLPTETTTLVGRGTTDTFTNKTIDASNNTITGFTKVNVGLSNVENIKVNLSATVDPISTNDNSSGYSVGSRWINVTNNKEYVCVDATTSAAIWSLTNSSSTDDIVEGSNLYYTDVRVNSNIDTKKGSANGLASLDGSGKIPASQLNLSNVLYLGAWNPNTNTPTLMAGVGSQGHYYVISGAGSTNLDGNTDWQPGDWVIFNGTVWEKADHTDAVTSVAGKQGAVTLDSDDVTEGSNLYYTEERVDANTNVIANTTHRSRTDNPHSVTKSQIGLGNVADIKVNLSATTSPSVTDDSTAGYSVGSRWIDTISDKDYVCVDSTASAAIWNETTQIDTGEANTAANVGTGIGVFKQKAGLNFDFKTISSGSNKVVIIDGVDEIELDVNLSNGDVGLSNVQNIKDNRIASFSPTVASDTSEGYSIGSRWLDTTASKEYICVDATSSAAVWNEINSSSGDVVGPVSSMDNYIPRFDGTTGKLIQGPTSGQLSYDDAGSLTSTGYKTGYMFNLTNTLNTGSGNGLNIKSGEVLGDIALHIADQDDTSQLLEIEADQGFMTLGKTYAQTFTDNGIVYGVDNQHTANATDYNTQNGVYRIGGSDVVNVSQTLTNKTLTSTTNNVTANSLHSATTTIDVSSATSPTTGQVLTATSATSAIWQSPSASNLVNYSNSSTLTSSTTLSTYHILNNLTNTPPSGTYLVSFSSSGSSIGSAESNYAIFVDDNIIPESERRLGVNGGSATNSYYTSLHTQAVITVNGFQTVSIRRKTSSGIFEISSRNMILLKLD